MGDVSGWSMLVDIFLKSPKGFWSFRSSLFEVNGPLSLICILANFRCSEALAFFFKFEPKSDYMSWFTFLFCSNLDLLSKELFSVELSKGDIIEAIWDYRQILILCYICGLRNYSSWIDLTPALLFRDFWWSPFVCWDSCIIFFDYYWLGIGSWIMSRLFRGDCFNMLLWCYEILLLSEDIERELLWARTGHVE